MGMTQNQLQLVRCICENRIDDARKAALACCVEDNTKKNEHTVNKYKKILQNGSNFTDFKIPYQVQGLVTVEDVSNFRGDRYYLENGASNLAERIEKTYNTSLTLMEMDVPYVNATLLTGESGTGKTTFAKYMAYRLGLPYVYVNFTYIVDSLMGKTAQNIKKIFEFVKENKCLLMLDEIDAIGSQRYSGSTGADKERSNTTISLLQELDLLRNDTIVIAATNIPDELDKAVIRRFSIKYRFEKLRPNENKELILKFISSIKSETKFSYSEENIDKYIESTRLSGGKVQADIVNELTEALVDAISSGTYIIEL